MSLNSNPYQRKRSCREQKSSSGKLLIFHGCNGTVSSRGAAASVSAEGRISDDHHMINIVLKMAKSEYSVKVTIRLLPHHRRTFPACFMESAAVPPKISKNSCPPERTISTDWLHESSAVSVVEKTHCLSDAKCLLDVRVAVSDFSTCKSVDRFETSNFQSCASFPSAYLQYLLDWRISSFRRQVYTQKKSCCHSISTKLSDMF